MSEQPAVWAWKPKLQTALVFRTVAVAHDRGPKAARRPVLRDFFEQIVMRVEEEAQARGKLIDCQAARERPIHVLDAVAQREGQFLHRRRAGFANVIAADRNRVEARRMTGGKLDGVGNQAHRRPRRVDVFFLGDVFLQNVVLQGAGHPRPVDALLLGNGQVHRPNDRRRRVDGHRDADFAERNAAQQNLHVFERRNGRAALADFAFRHGMIAVVAHQRGQIEGYRKSGLSLFQQVVVAEIGFFRRGKTGELAHGPQLAAVHRLVNSAGVGERAGLLKIARGVETG